MGRQKDSRKSLFANFLLAAIRVTVPDGFSQVIPRADQSRWPLSPAGRRSGWPVCTIEPADGGRP